VAFPENKATAAASFQVSNYNQQEGKLEEVLASYLCALEQNPNFDAVHYQVWALLAPLQKWEEAAAWYRQALEINPNAALAYHHLGAALAGLKQTEEAIVCYHQATELNPNFLGTYLALGDALAAVDRWEECLASYRRTLELCPSNDAVHYQVWTALAPLQKWEEAAAWYRQALEINPNAGLAYHHLGAALAGLKQTEEAITCYHQAIELNPNFLGTYLVLGDALAEAERWDEAIVSYRRTLELNPNFDSVHYQVWTALAPLQKWEEAVAWYRQALEINPNAASAHHHLGAALAGLENWEAAAASYRQATELNPNFYGTYLLLKDAIKNLHLNEEIAFCRRAIEIGPDFRYYELLSAALAKKGLLNEAISVYHQAVLLQPYTAETYLSLGMLLTLQGQVNEAIAAYQHALQLRSDCVEAYCNLAYIWSQQNQWDEAQASYRRACEIKSEVANLDWLTEHFQTTSRYRVIDITYLNHSDSKFLEAAGFSLEALTCKLNISCREKVLETGAIELLCPWSKKKIVSNQSFFIDRGCHVTFYRFVGNEVFYLIGIAYLTKNSSFPLSALYFPSRELIVFQFYKNYQNKNYENYAIQAVNTFKSYILHYLEDCKFYIDNKLPKKISTILGGADRNIGHYFLNEVSAIKELHEAGNLNRLESSIVTCNYLDIKEIIPEINAEIPNLLTYNVEEKLPETVFQICLRNNLLVLPLGCANMSEDLFDRINDVAIKKCPQEFLDKVLESRQHFPLLWISIRTHKRVWLSQVEGIVNIIKKLALDFPNLGVIFDGVPRDQAVMEQIAALIPRAIETYSALDCAVCETIVWAGAIDLFVAPLGAGMVFTCIANKPGVAHGHRDWCPPDPFCPIPRKDGVLVIPIHANSIVDCFDSQYHDRTSRNYGCNWQVIYNEVMKILENLQRKRIAVRSA
jgi:tetratricopeptide (TPR) repeat protein